MNTGDPNPSSLSQARPSQGHQARPTQLPQYVRPGEYLISGIHSKPSRLGIPSPGSGQPSPVSGQPSPEPGQSSPSQPYPKPGLPSPKPGLPSLKPGLPVDNVPANINSNNNAPANINSENNGVSCNYHKVGFSYKHGCYFIENSLNIRHYYFG